VEEGRERRMDREEMSEEKRRENKRREKERNTEALMKFLHDVWFSFLCVLYLFLRPLSR